MPSDTTIVAGIEVPSTSPIFLTVVGLHVLMGLTCVVAGAVAMLIPKRQGPHPTFGTMYFWCLLVVFGSATWLSVFRWAQDYPLFILGTLSFAAALIGRTFRRRRWPGWIRVHITGMGASYILLLTAFYVDNGKSLPLWKELPPIAFWLIPSAVGIPIVLNALLRHPLVRQIDALDRGRRAAES
ncbi:MAG TPA: hypothetical protein VGR45_06655 [Stellaceae bacterium]|nr:hypothetical protein [Stellaceae bacterium]